jgi:hypothetical protein
MALGATAGVAYWLWALPWDTIKTWIQTGRIANLRHAWVQQQHHQHGYSSLFRGWQVAYGRGAPSAAITVATYAYVFDTLCGSDIAASENKQ